MYRSIHFSRTILTIVSTFSIRYKICNDKFTLNFVNDVKIYEISFLYFQKREDLQYRYMTCPFTSNNYERWFLDGGYGKLKHTAIIFREFPESPLWTPFLHLPPPLCYFRIQYEGSRVHPTWRVALWNGVSPYRMGETIMPPRQSRAIL